MFRTRFLCAGSTLVLAAACQEISAPDRLPRPPVTFVTTGPGEPGPTGGVTQSLQSPISGEIYDPCLNEGILFEGFVHTLVTTAEAPNNISHVTLITNFEGVTGTGLASGDTYKVISTAVRSVLSFDGIGIIPFVYTEMVFGALAGNTAILSFRRHTTVTPDGNIAVDYTVEEVRCAPPGDGIVIGSGE